MNPVRQPAVAGLFYPDNPATLKAQVDRLLSHAQPLSPAPKAIVAPHAGYVYSGAIAAAAYASVQGAANTIQRVVLLGPAHRVALQGLAASTASAFQTPLGNVSVDQESIDRILALPQVVRMDAAHSGEHSLEVHLPFLQIVLPGFRLVPLVVGDATADEVGEVLTTLWGGDETLIVISSDLSHYHDYDTARRLDSATCRAIEALDPDRIGFENACGRVPLNGLLHVAAQKGLKVHTLDLRNSGDTAGSRDQVVGYGAWAFH